METRIYLDESDIKAYKKLNRIDNFASACRGPFFLKAILVTKYEETKADFFRGIAKKYGVPKGSNVGINGVLYYAEIELPAGVRIENKKPKKK